MGSRITKHGREQATPDPGRRSPARLVLRGEKGGPVSQRPIGVVGYEPVNKTTQLVRAMARELRTKRAIAEGRHEYTPTKPRRKA